MVLLPEELLKMFMIMILMLNFKKDDLFFCLFLLVKILGERREKEREKNQWKQWPATPPSTTTGGARKLPRPIICFSGCYGDVLDP